MNKGTLSKRRKAYTSTLREKQSGETRGLIIDSVARMLRAGKLEDLSFASVAKISGASVATVYRYFPSRKALFEGLSEWLVREINPPAPPKSIDELVGKTPEIFAFYAKNYDLFTTQKAAAVIREMNEESSRKRDRSVAKLMADHTRHLDERRANAVHALMRHLYGSDAFITMHDRFGVTAEEAAQAVGWAGQLILKQLEKDSAKEGKSK
jgi:AcrR family transcriptional regulator